MMDYSGQRLQGSKAITEHALNIASKLQLQHVACTWNNGKAMIDRPEHIFTIFHGTHKISDSISDEDLADFPGKSGTEITKSKLRAMFRKLSAESGL